MLPVGRAALRLRLAPLPRAEWRRAAVSAVVGRLQKMQGGVEQLFTDADSFGLEFPNGASSPSQLCCVARNRCPLAVTVLPEHLWWCLLLARTQEPSD